jgi:hypothetical protein
VQAEEAAVKTALRGNTAPLAALLRDENAHWLKPETRELVDQFMTGARDPKTGRRKGKDGRPKMTMAARLAANPIHQAAGDARLIQQELRKLYPEQKVAIVRKFTRAFVAERAGITVEKLNGYLARARHSPQRI